MLSQLDELRFEGVSKRFDAVDAVRRVTFYIRAGEIVALLGENGAGKSTLVKIAAGLIAPDEGLIFIKGRPYRRLTPSVANQLGIGLVQQELAVCPDLTVAENMFLGTATPTRGGFLRYSEMEHRTQEILDNLAAKVSARQFMRTLTLAQTQLVEFAKQWLRRPHILILDEATSALSSDQAEMVYRYTRKLAEEGSIILLITHRMDELRYADRVVVLRDGELVGELSEQPLDTDKAIALMLGRELKTVFPPRRERHSSPEKPPLLEVSQLRLGGRQPIAFQVHEGEVLGIGGLSGHGQHELMRWLFGLENFSGQIKIDGQFVTLRSPVEAMRARIAYVPEERKTEALLIELSGKINMILPGMLDRFSRLGILRSNKIINEAIQNGIDRFHVKWSGPHTIIRQLSGGNQQKVAVARWWLRDPRIYLLEDPTRGIDVGSKREIYTLLQELTQSGAAVLLTSSDTLELIHLCDRVLVLYERDVIAEYAGDQLTEERLIRAFVTGRAS
ncbi:MAG: sugar ABC transporter ATP-binding protein [Firmicutes bacterium]|nr:sugar ABC transporter ATP-binding protein [Bacillota bacterium]